MSTTLMTPQLRSSHVLSAHAVASVASDLVALPASAHAMEFTATNAPTPANPTYMAWLGGVDTKGCTFGKYVTKRITPGALERGLT